MLTLFNILDSQPVFDGEFPTLSFTQSSPENHSGFKAEPMISAILGVEEIE